MAAFCIAGQLFKRYWNMVYALLAMVLDPKDMLLATVHDSGVGSVFPCGCAVAYKGHIEIFVIAKYRRKGCGTLLVNALKKKTKLATAHPGARGSEAFWRKHDIQITGTTLNDLLRADRRTVSHFKS